MVVTVTCTGCGTDFPVDSLKVPEGGVYAQCSVCPEIFRVERPDEEQIAAQVARVRAGLPAVESAGPAVPPDVPPGADPDLVAGLADASPPEPFGAPAAAAAAAAASAPAQPSEPAVSTAADASTGSADVATDVTTDVVTADATADRNEMAPVEPPAAPVFGKRDPHERAARLARVLVSDMIAYHPDRHRKSLEAGTLPQDFDEEIQRSWSEYVQQVGLDLAEGTEYWKNALNQVLAKGDPIF